MNIRFLGTGGAFDPEYGSSAAVLDAGNDQYILIDAGCTTYLDLKRSNWLERITHVVITHLHDDHVGSLGSILNHRKHMSDRVLTLLMPPGLRDPLVHLLGLQKTSGPVESMATLQDLADGAADASRHIGETWVDFVDTSGRHQENMPSYAYIFRRGDDSIAYSGDLADGDVVFRELESRGLRNAMVCHDATFEPRASRAHTYYEVLEAHREDGWNIRAYHHDPSRKPAACRLTLVTEDPEIAPQR